MGSRVFAIVRRKDYGHLRRILPDLPSNFGTWIEQRFAERRDFERATTVRAKCKSLILPRSLILVR